jgi:putative nucleotidyltransferase with HDIG domain
MHLETLLIALAIVAVSVLVLRQAEAQQSLLDVYFLPVAWAAWRLGQRRGAAAAVASAVIVLGASFMNDRLFAASGAAEPWVRWTNLGLWAGFLFLTAYATATLAARDARRILDLEKAYTGILEIMAKFIDSIDRSTENHSRRVAERAVEVARELGVAERDVESIRVASFLHDIGKVDVSAEVLGKAATLSQEERAEMEKHVDYGTAMLERVGGLLGHVVPLVLYHHERWDGRGYKRIAGTAIPLGSRIIAVCDTYDAIVADRPYRRGQSHEQAIAILRAESGIQFDPEIIEVFLRLYDVTEEADTSRAA